MDKERLNEINEILELGKKILDIEEIIKSTKYMKQYQQIISVMKGIKNDLAEEIASHYKEPTYSVDNSTITKETSKTEETISKPILGVTPEIGVKYTTEEPAKKPLMSDEEKEKHQSYINEKIKESLNNKEEIKIDQKDDLEEPEKEEEITDTNDKIEEPEPIITPKRTKPNAYTKRRNKPKDNTKKKK
jgi:hypothetical protein